MYRPGQQRKRNHGLDLVGHDRRRARARRRGYGAVVEILEERRVLSSLDITSGALTYSADAGTASDLAISVDAGHTTLTFADPSQAITLTANALAANWSNTSPNIVTGPVSSVTSMLVNGATTSGQDLTVDYTTGDPLPASGLTFSPTGASGSASNKLTLQSGPGGTAFTTETYAPSGPGAGTITYSDSANSNVPIAFSNLSPIDDSVTSPTFIFTAPSTATTVNVNTDGVLLGSQADQINAGGTGAFELINFANKTAVTVNVPAAGATTTLNIPTLAVGLSSLNVSSGAGGETVNVQAIPAGITVNVDTGSGAGSTTNVGLGGSLTAIDSPVTVKSTGGSNVLAIDDHAQTSGQTYTITGSRVTASSSSSHIDFGTGITTLDLTTSGKGDTVGLTGLIQSDVKTYNLTANVPGPNTLNVDVRPDSISTLDLNTPGVLSFGGSNPVVNYSNFQPVNVFKKASQPVGTGVTIDATVGQPLNNVLVATFTDSDLGNAPADFSAMINWGDGTGSSTGLIQPSGPNSYNILGTHIYSANGTHTINVALTDNGGTGTTLISGVRINVTSTGPVSSTPSPIVSSANVTAAPLTAMGATVRGIEGNALVNPLTGSAPVLVATFMDTGTPALTGYTATIDWGDGSTSTGTITPSTPFTPNGVVYSITGSHTYAETGTYAVNVSITNTATGAKAIASGQAVIADAALAPSGTQPTVSTTEDVSLSGVVGSFTDADSKAPVTDFTYVTIDWGDGTPDSVGTISQPGGTGAAFLVSGTHTYEDAGVNGGIGHYPITINLHDVDGSTTTISNTANVVDVALVVTGKLNPASDSGISNTDNITNVVQPNFIGNTSQPNAAITLYATASGSSVPVPIGTGTSDASGTWSITSNQALADGAYTITAIAVDSSGHTISSTATIVPNLVIDTVGPKVTSVLFRRLRGEIVVTYQDGGGLNNTGVGLVPSSVVDANNYQLITVHHPRLAKYRFNAITDVPGTTTGLQTATLTVNRGLPIRGGWYFFTIRSANSLNTSGIRDIAGNAMDGEFYGYYPSGNNVRGGDFVAMLTAIHHTTYAPSSVIGRATPVSPPGSRERNIIIPGTITPGVLATLAGATTRSQATRQSARVAPHSGTAGSRRVQQAAGATGSSSSSDRSGSRSLLNAHDRAIDQLGPTGKTRKS